ncbi:MAG: EF-hand domain-containing protein [Limisphaerales bacterium]
MKTTTKMTLALMALGLSALAAGAQNDNPPPFDGPGPGGPGGFGGPGGPRGHHPPPLPLVLALDVNHDGIIDSNEIANASAELLTLDKNHDGQLTPDEYLPPLPPGAPTNSWRPPVPPIVKALDANGDGIIDSNEIANASAELLTLDKNHDGQLTPDEYIPRSQHRHGPPPGMGQNPPGEQQGPPDGAQPPPNDGQGMLDNSQDTPDAQMGQADDGPFVAQGDQQGPSDDGQGPPNDMPPGPNQ